MTQFNLGGFVLPAGDNTVYQIWATVSVANASPNAQGSTFLGVVARDDDGDIVLNLIAQVGDAGAGTLLGTAVLDVTDDVVSFLMNKIDADDAEYCLQLVFAPCALQSVVLPGGG